MAPRRVGVFGGTFDPPHLGHVGVARAVVGGLELDELVVTVANEPQGKAEPPVAGAPDRLAMARAAFEGLDRVTVSDLELARGGPTYTIDTVEALLAGGREGPGGVPEVVLVVGADAAAGLAGWHRAGELAGLAAVAIVPRPGSQVVHPPGFRVREVAVDPVDLSSTGVRERLRAGEEPAGLVPVGVVLFLLTHPLYAP